MEKEKSNPLKDIFGKVWAAWGGISFIITFLIIFIPSMIAYLIPGRPGQVWFIQVSRVWMRIWLFLIGCPLRINGRQNFEKGKAYVVVYNHNAFLDVPLSAPFVPGANKTIAKNSFAKVPLFGLFYRKGSVLVDRNSDTSRRKSYEAMKEVLKQNMHMCIYPEGTRNRTDEPLKQFYDGAFKLAVDSGKEVIPCLIFGTRKAMPFKKGFYLLPTKLQMDFLPPVSSAKIKPAELKDKVYNIMRSHYVAGLARKG